MQSLKASSIFAVGLVFVCVVFFVIHSVRSFALCASFLVLFFVVAGFRMRPARDVYYLQPKHEDQVVVRVHLTRLWLLFLPTCGSLGFLIAAVANGLSWVPSEAAESFSGFATFYGLFGALAVVLALLSVWVGERLTFKDAAACYAESVARHGRELSYAFVDRHGEYFGGRTQFHLRHAPAEIYSLVFYNIGNPQLNRLASAMVFHQAEIVRQ